MAKDDKTNVMRVLDQKKVSYKAHTYEPDPGKTGAEIAVMLGNDPKRVFKTLVTEGKSGEHFVFVIPVEKELDLKKAAKAVGEKSISMIPQKNLLPLTGYVHGGCSPIGMKKFFRTTIDESAKAHETICFSAGRVGCQVETDPRDLEKVIRIGYADLCTE